MKQIFNKGNLPGTISLFSKQAEGQWGTDLDTEFWEASSIKEFEENAVKIGYEIVPTIDQKTGRGFLVGFDVEEPQFIVTMGHFARLKMYFVEATSAEIKTWDKKIRQDRTDQQEDMRNRQERAKAKKVPKNVTVQENQND